MQLRKLIRLLEEAKKEHGDRIEVCLDAEFARRYDLTYVGIERVSKESCQWEGQDYKEKPILVLGGI